MLRNKPLLCDFLLVVTYHGISRVSVKFSGIMNVPLFRYHVIKKFIP